MKLQHSIDTNGDKKSIVARVYLGLYVLRRRLRSACVSSIKRTVMDKTDSVRISQRLKQGPTSAGATVPPASILTFFPVPLEIVEEIFLNLPPEQVVLVCRFVCRQWKEVADSESLWRERCRREGYHPRGASKIPRDWRLFYFLCKKRRNLLKNPRAEEKLSGWQIVENGGQKWATEGIRAPHPEETVQKNFVTSFGWCIKSQLIDLEKEGYKPSFIDHFQPHIRISDWYAQRIDCGCLYHIRVELLNQRQMPVQTFAPETVYLQQWNEEKWYQMTHVFQNYGPGVRYIRFTHGGKDSQFWAGWYGVRLTDSCVEICPAMNT